MPETKKKYLFSWCFLFYAFAAFFGQDCLGHKLTSQDSICSETEIRVIYIISDDPRSELTVSVASEFLRASFFKFNSTSDVQAAVARVSNDYKGTFSCHARSYVPSNTTKTDYDYSNSSINCHNATNFEKMHSLLFEDKTGEDFTGRLFIFTVDVEDFNIDFFAKHTGNANLDARAYRIFTDSKLVSDREPVSKFDTYYKNQYGLIVKSLVIYNDAREMNRSISALISDVCEEDPAFSYHTMSWKEDDTFMRFRIKNDDLFYPRKNITMDWRTEEIECGKLGMKLLAPRSPSEADRFVASFNQLLENTSYTSHSENNQTELNIYIGLQRGQRGLGHRFEWRFGAAKLFYGKWAPQEPKGVNKCAYWQFKFNQSTGNWESVGWRSCACSVEIPHLSLCQTRIYALRAPITIPDDGQPFNSSRLYSKGNFVEVWDKGNKTILSLTEAVTTDRLQKMMRSGGDKVQIGNLLSPEPQSFTFEEREAIFGKLAQMFHTCRVRDINSMSRTSRDGVSLAEVCDGRFQCGTRSDENQCGQLGYANCTASEFTCESRECIPIEFRCDLIKDCEDGSDEFKCEFSECRHDQCSDRTCLPKPWLSDGQRDCEDEKDDPQSPQFHHNKPCVFACERTKCIKESQLEDDVSDCNGPEGPLDVTLKPFGTVDCGLENLHRVAPKCVMVLDEFGEVIGCRDLRHLSDCANFYPCPEGFIKCPNSYCIPQGYLADGKEDCIKGEDEFDIKTPDPARNFVCNESTNQSVGLLALCDGKKDCQMGEDELDCGYPQIPGFLSLAGALAVYDHSKVNSSDVLANIDKRTRYLVLSGVHLPDFFLTYPFSNLRHLLSLNLSNTGQRTVYRQARDDPKICEDLFRIPDFYAVRSIDLSHNNITDLPACSYLQMMKGLKYLSLAHNRHLTNLTREMFTNLSTVSELDLSYIGATDLDPDLLGDLTNLQRLTLKGLTLDRFYLVIPETVTYLNLENIQTKDLDNASFDNITDLPELRVSTFVYCCSHILGSRIQETSCHAPPEYLSSCGDLVKDTSKRNCIQTISVMAVVGNLATLAYRLLWSRDVLSTPRKLFATCLSMSDLLMGVYLATMTLADYVMRGSYVVHQALWRHSNICNIAGVLANLASLTSACFVFLLTLDQVQIVKYPKSQTRFTARKAQLVALGTWVVALAVVIPPMTPVGKAWNVYSTNGLCQALRTGTERDGSWYFSITVFLVVMGTLYMTTMIGQMCIFGRSRSTGSHFMRRMRLERQEVIDARLQELSMARRISRLAFCDFFFYCAIGVTIILSWRGEYISVDVQVWTMVLFIPINSAINPLVYFYPAWSKRLDKLQRKYKRQKGRPAETSDSRKNTSTISGTGLESDMAQGADDLVLPEDEHELLNFCCDELGELKEAIEWERKGGDYRVPLEELINRNDLDMLDEELKLLEQTLLEVMEKTKENEENTTITENNEASDPEKGNRTAEYDDALKTENACQSVDGDETRGNDNVGQYLDPGHTGNTQEANEKIDLCDTVNTEEVNENEGNDGDIGANGKENENGEYDDAETNDENDLNMN